MDGLYVLIPLAPFMLAGFAIWSKHQRRLAEMQMGVAAEKAAHQATRNRELEERVRVLERIVTDKGYDVAAQIEALRDARVTEHRDQPAEPQTRQ